MVELDHLVRTCRMSDEEVIDGLIAAGLDSCPGGGAEIFRETHSETRYAPTRPPAIDGWNSLERFTTAEYIPTPQCCMGTSSRTKIASITL